ncbi:MAG: hypothetical protein QMB37_01565 [Paludibacteraceae bacterium]
MKSTNPFFISDEDINLLEIESSKLKMQGYYDDESLKVKNCFSSCSGQCSSGCGANCAGGCAARCGNNCEGGCTGGCKNGFF